MSYSYKSWGILKKCLQKLWFSVFRFKRPICEAKLSKKKKYFLIPSTVWLEVSCHAERYLIAKRQLGKKNISVNLSETWKKKYLFHTYELPVSRIMTLIEWARFQFHVFFTEIYKYRIRKKKNMIQNEIYEPFFCVLKAPKFWSGKCAIALRRIRSK